ncbi:MAG: formate/nitrite transporter family protein [Chitinophagaceae bacterium]|nr:formate/nitrite transporter family protein [Chitinophagaceae bacterium]
MFTPSEIAVPFADAAVKKAGMPLRLFALYAVLGGAFIALGGLLSIVVAGGMPGIAQSMPGLIKLLAGAVFPVGLVLVVVAGAGLFTSDCATLPMAYWQGRLTAAQLLKVAGVGFAANFVGALGVAWLLGYQTGTLSHEPWATYTRSLALHKTEASFFTVFAKGVGANLMVCLAVWMATAAKEITGKVLLLWMPVMAFVAIGWEHSIANMFFIPAGMLLGAPVSVSQFLLHNLLPATLGNMVGGALLVALPYHLLWGKRAKVATEDTFNIKPQQETGYLKGILNGRDLSSKNN